MTERPRVSAPDHLVLCQIRIGVAVADTTSFYSLLALRIHSHSAATTENAGVENAGVEKAGVGSTGGNSRSKPCGTPTRDYIEKAFSYVVRLVLILLTE